jgi:DNA-binding MarR family transcriptional regulator
MASVVASEIKQDAAFTSAEQEILLGVLVAAARLVEPWEKFLKAGTGLTNNQYNVLRILRGSHPIRLSCGEIADRMIARDPDVTRLVDRLGRRGLVSRVRSREDRRVVEVGITEKGRELLRTLDPHASRMPPAMIGHLGAKQLSELRRLLERLISGLGTFP